MMAHRPCTCSTFFFFNDTATTEIYTLSLHDALPISPALQRSREPNKIRHRRRRVRPGRAQLPRRHARSEEHTSELQSLAYLVCRLLLEKKKKKPIQIHQKLKKNISLP